MGGSVRISGAALELPGGVTVRFMRTLRLPETGTHPLPPGLGAFPLRTVADYHDRVPAEWLSRGGVFLPVYQREAIWLSFSATAPAALQIGVGKVCAVSGRPWSDQLSQDPQNYVVLPRQPWLDGINSGSGTIRQFVAVPLGAGATVEGQVPVSGEETWGGVRLQVFELARGPLAAWRAEQARRSVSSRGPWGVAAEEAAYGGAVPGAVPPPGGGLPRKPAEAMGLGAGGRMRQEVYRDERRPGDWRGRPAGRVFVHLATAPQWRLITGEAPAPSPVDQAAYTRAGLPWFACFDADAEDLPAAGPLAEVRQAGDWLDADEQAWVTPQPGQVRKLRDDREVTDGEW